MFNGMLTNIEQSSIELAQNLSSWNIKIFGALVLIEFLIMMIAYTFSYSKVEELPVKFYKLMFYTFTANTIFMWLPQIWVMGWDTINYLANLAAGETIDYSPAAMLKKAFVIVGELFQASIDDGAKASFGSQTVVTLMNFFIALPIAFAVFFLFCLIVAELVVNYAMWIITGSLGGIFILLFVITSTRPMFYNYIKYMFGLLFKTLGLFLMVALLSTLIDTQVHYDKHIGEKPSIETCNEIDTWKVEAAKCTTNECKERFTAQIEASNKTCQAERKAVAKWTEESQKGFLERSKIPF